MNCTHALTSNKLLQVIESENNVLTGPKQAVKKVLYNYIHYWLWSGLWEDVVLC